MNPTATIVSWNAAERRSAENRPRRLDRSRTRPPGSSEVASGSLSSASADRSGAENGADRPSVSSASPLDALAALCDRMDEMDARVERRAASAPPAANAPVASDGTISTDSAAYATAEEAEQALAELGAKVVRHPDGLRDGSRDGSREGSSADWAALAGTEEVRTLVEEALVLPLRYPSALAAITRGTRAETATPMPARPAALLFYGPPGTGKTSAARLAAQEAGLPLVYAPLETLVSKWMGQGEQQLAGLFAASSALGPCIIFMDELDALAGSREKELHEASRRMLSVLLRRMDGFDASDNTALIGATNRRRDLDPALLSRFDVQVHFPPPDATARAAIFARYARHLPDAELDLLAGASDGCSGREILDVCRQTERRWASIMLRRGITAQAADGRAGGVEGDGVSVSETKMKISLPPLSEYKAALQRRRA